MSAPYVAVPPLEDIKSLLVPLDLAPALSIEVNLLLASLFSSLTFYATSSAALSSGLLADLERISPKDLKYPSPRVRP